MKKTRNEEATLDMTPMIDVVFQLIIFFVVTLKMTDNKDVAIKLEDGQYGIVLEQPEVPQAQLMIDVITSADNQGLFKISNQRVTLQEIQKKVKERYLKYHDFTCMIRADWKTKHRHIRQVMAACLAGQFDARKQNSNVALDPKISFVAINKVGTQEPISLSAHWGLGMQREQKKTGAIK